MRIETLMARAQWRSWPRKYGSSGRKAGSLFSPSPASAGEGRGEGLLERKRRMHMGQLQGRVALITGAGRGQGLAAARRFAAEGARIVVNDLDAESVKAAVDSIRATGSETVGAVGDVSVSTDVRRVLKVAQDTFGGLDILYNN